MAGGMESTGTGDGESPGLDVGTGMRNHNSCADRLEGKSNLHEDGSHSMSFSLFRTHGG